MRVLHFIRKKSQLKASFIKNQIENHINFKPYVIFYQTIRDKENDGGFANEVNNGIELIDLGSDTTIYEEILFRVFKRISKRKQSKLIDSIITINPDALHFHYGTDAGIYLHVLKKINIPKFVSFYGYECSSFPKRFFGFGRIWLNIMVYRYVDNVFAMSPDMKTDIIRTGCPEDKVIVHYYGSDVCRFKRYHNYYRNSQVRFLIISGLVPQKGHLFLLEAFKKAYIHDRNIRLTIIGDGPLKEKMLGFIAENQLNDLVTIPGPVVYGSEEHIQALDSHDVFIHPSVTDVNGDKEGIPGSIVEAMAAGLPIISTYHAGIPHIIETNKTGILVLEYDINLLSVAILQMAQSVKLREHIGIAGQEYALKNLDIRKKEMELEAFYKLKSITND
jgi:colanic acid/amylovoran biosynthesis glycosyltransferase